MGTQIITISATTAKPEPLSIKDNQGNSGKTKKENKALTTKVHHGDKVKWKIAPQSDITEIKKITCDNGNDLFISGDPKSNNNGKYWEGTISNTANGEEEYTIFYIVGTTTYKQDPKLKIPLHE